jgi:flagellar biosynthetic protein FliP
MSTQTRHFIRHYLEMVAAMFAGMIVLGVPGEAALRALGSSSSQLQADAPALALLGMAVIMTIPMVALMRYRGHTWRPCWEMSASMLLPTFGVIGALWAGAGDFMTLMMAEHAIMLPAMLVAMLLRYAEYAGCGHRPAIR